MQLNVQVDPQSVAKVLATLADMDAKARDSLTKKALRQTLGPLQRRVRKRWKSHPVKGNSERKARRAIARATLIQVDRYRGTPSKITGKAMRSPYGKVYISYKNKYGASKLAHLLENPKGTYDVETSWKIHTQEYRRWVPIARSVFARVTEAFIQGYQMKDIRAAVKGQIG